MALPAAQPAEVLRASQKDDHYRTKLSALLSQLLPPKRANLATPISSLLYSGSTTLRDLQTLGEEYSGIVQVDDSYHSLPTRLSRLLSILLSLFGENLCRHMLKHAEKNVEKNTYLKESARNALILTTKSLSEMLNQFERVHRALCYIYGGPLQLGKAVTGIDYVQVRPAATERYAHLRLLGIVTLIHSLICCAKVWLQTRDHITSLNDMSSELTSTNTCVACLSELTQPCVLPCGHLFCMQCCYGALEMCALCRSSFLKCNVVPLKNYVPNMS